LRRPSNGVFRKVHPEANDALGVTHGGPVLSRIRPLGPSWFVTSRNCSFGRRQNSEEVRFRMRGIRDGLLLNRSQRWCPDTGVKSRRGSGAGEAKEDFRNGYFRAILSTLAEVLPVKRPN